MAMMLNRMRLVSAASRLAVGPSRHMTRVTTASVHKGMSQESHQQKGALFDASGAKRLNILSTINASQLRFCASDSKELTDTKASSEKGKVKNAMTTEEWHARENQMKLQCALFFYFICTLVYIDMVYFEFRYTRYIFMFGILFGIVPPW